jgi:signal transduction histidine kinase/ligand-binding sensor domain-containing protein/DNA-binding response OmpR family regulator
MKNLLLLLLLNGYISIFAQSDFNIDKIDSRKNLTSDNVFDIIQDKEGYIWICTDEGLNRYDGYDIKTVKSGAKNYFFSSNYFTCIEEDDSDNLWIGTKNDGLNVYNKKTGEIKHILFGSSGTSGIINNSIQDLLFDIHGNMWVGTYNGLHLFRKGSHRAYSFRKNQKKYKVFPEGSIISMFQDANGDILFGTWNSILYKYSVIEDKFYKYPFNADNETLSTNTPIRSFEQAGENMYWIGTWDKGLYKVKIINNKLEIIEHLYCKKNERNNVIKSNIIFSLKNDAENNLWIGTPEGVSVIRHSQKIIHIDYGNTKTTLSNKEAWKIIHDKSGVIWVATLGGGVNAIQLNRQTFKTYTIPDIDFPIKSQIINSFFKLNNNELLIGVRGIGFGLYDLNNQSFRQYRQIKMFDNLPRTINSVFCFYQENCSTLLIGTRYYGLFSLNLKTYSCKHILPEKNNHRLLDIKTLIKDKYNSLWVGTDAGLYKLVPFGNQQYTVYRYIPDINDPKSLLGLEVNKIHIDPENKLWVATNKGLNTLISNIKDHHNLKFKVIELCTENPASGFNTIFEDSKKRLWFGSENNGLLNLDKKTQKLTSFKSYQSIMGETIYDIIEDKIGNLWITTNIGLIRVTLNSGENLKIQRFSYKDGLQGSRFNRGAVLKDSMGLIYLGGNYGFNIFNPTDFKTNNFIPPVVITDFLVNNKSVQYYAHNNKIHQLSFDNNNIKITVSALSYTNPERNFFAYKLSGYDKNWTYTDFNHRDAIYGNLPPGKYVFKVKAANDSYLWNEEPVTLSFRIKPSPFNSWYAYLIYLILISSVIIVLFRLRLNSVRLKQTFEIERIKHREQEKINQFKFRFFTNISHELLTPLSVISASTDEFILKKELNLITLKSIKHNVTRLLTLINQLLDFRKLETGNMKLQVAKYNIESYFDQLEQVFLPITSSKQIIVALEGNINKDIYFDADLLEKVFANLMSNAVKSIGREGKIIIDINLVNSDQGEELILSIIDSGKGIKEVELEYIFNSFYQGNGNLNKAGFGIGLALCKNLVELHKGIIMAQNKSEGQGAVFTVKIPVSRDSYKDSELAENTDAAFTLKEKIIDEANAEFINFIAPSKDKKITVLIVEDHDELRSLICRYLSDYYNIIEASDGYDGYSKTIQHAPDIVVSDVMMPGLEGYELCNKIKSDIETSHVQVILLTCKVTDEDRLAGYLAGADSYFTKPVNLKLLHIRIDSLLAQKEKNRKQFLNTFKVEAKNSEFSEIDKTFLENLTKFITTNMSNPEFGVTELRENFNMSNSSLFRKIQGLTGMSPNEFIRLVRLQEAANILLKHGKNVTETAIMVGFNDIGYFARCFKKQFGKTPKKFINA